MKIICATDFSSHAEAAGRLAASLAGLLGDSLVLTHVVQLPIVDYLTGIADIDRVEGKIREVALSRLDGAARALRDAGCAVELVLREGVADVRIVELAAETDARLIVMGSHGARAGSGWFIGNVAQRTVERAPCPVLVTRPPVMELANRPLRILVGIDASETSDAAIEWVRTLCRAGGCDVTFYNAYLPTHECVRLGLHGPRTLAEKDDEIVGVLTRELRDRIGEWAQGAMQLRIEPHWGSPAHALSRMAVDGEFDFVVLGTHQRHGLGLVRHGSVSRELLHIAQRSILLVPVSPRPDSSDQPIPRIRAVLAATDFSDLGNRALLHAYALLPAGGVVELCHVFERFVPRPIYAYDAKELALSPERRAELERQLGALIPQEAVQRGIRTHVSVIDGGSSGEAIAQAAERLGVDAICLGSHGRSGLAKALYGSVAQEVTRKARKPVFIVRP